MKTIMKPAFPETFDELLLVKCLVIFQKSAQEIIPTAPVEVIEVNEPFVDPLHEENSDRSYQFSYGSEQDESLRQEESDADGNIKGSFGKL